MTEHSCPSPLLNLRTALSQLIGPFELTTDKQDLAIDICTAIIFNLDGRAFAAITANRENILARIVRTITVVSRHRWKVPLRVTVQAVPYFMLHTKINVNCIYRVGRSQWPGGLKGVGLRPLSCWDCGFEYRRGHGRLSLRRADHLSRGVLPSVMCLNEYGRETS